ncbi:MAG: tetratricopeptide repeat protein [Tannerella sp.]|jgi:tetratricopeptide (TPR) repeat protein|nr:tetratricopeptide repeat protein [Tannerella sp.]
MKKFIIVVLMGIFSFPLMAQKNPKWVEKAKKAVFTVETLDKNGISHKGNGFFVSETGEAVSDYSLFNGAEKAVVTDADGRVMQVTKILGADELYDVIRFTVAVPKKVPFLPLINAMQAAGTEAYLLPPGTGKGELLKKGAITEVTKVKEIYGYYKIDMPLTSTLISTPLLTSEGEVFALAQADASGKNSTYGISVPYIQNIRIGSMDVLNKTYSSIGIRKAWAATPEDAQIALLFYSSQQDAPTYLETLNDLIATFPNTSDGYMNRASHYAYHRKELAASEAEQAKMLEWAQADMNTALKYSTKQDEVYYGQAKLIYGLVMNDSTIPPKDWNIDSASEKLQKAIAREDLPAYRQLEGDIAFYLEDYAKAYNAYMLVNESEVASASSFYMAAKAKQQIPGTSIGDVIALMDSAVNIASPSDALAYLQDGIDLKMQFGQYEAVVKDYDRYYDMLGGNVTDAFYYYREQAKFRAGDLDEALKDIQLALKADPNNAMYHAEEASIYLRLKEPVKAQASAEKALALEPDFAACHRILGVCLVRQEKTKEACTAFQKAKELGDPVADKLIKENCQ